MSESAARWASRNSRCLGLCCLPFNPHAINKRPESWRRAVQGVYLYCVPLFLVVTGRDPKGRACQKQCPHAIHLGRGQKAPMCTRARVCCVLAFARELCFARTAPAKPTLPFLALFPVSLQQVVVTRLVRV
jgi:hypothetical protein